MLTNSQCEELLARYPELRTHADAEFLSALRHAQLLTFERDTALFHEGSSCAAFMWLLEGTVRVFKTSQEGREVTVYRVSPGELCLLTLNSLLRNERYPASARSETPAKGLMMTTEEFQALMARSPGFRDYVLQALVERLADVMSLMSDITFERIHLRAACFLGQQFERSGGMPLEITHAQIASELGTTREVISRILKQFERQKCISLHRGQIHLVSQNSLKWFAESRGRLEARG